MLVPENLDVTKAGRPVQFVDPGVSRAKFNREIENYRAFEGEYLRRGWLLIRAEFPEVYVVMAAAHLNPAPVVVGLLLDFSNFDYWPPSLRFVNPFTKVPMTVSDLSAFQMPRRVVTEAGEGLPQNLVQAHQDQKPFVCARGIREYHSHPAHTNDPWLPYRNARFGGLYHILNLVHTHGVQPMPGWNVTIQQMAFEIRLLPADPRKAPV